MQGTGVSPCQHHPKATPAHRVAQARRKEVPCRPPLRPQRAKVHLTHDPPAPSRGHHRLLQNMLTALLPYQQMPQQPSWDRDCDGSPHCPALRALHTAPRRQEQPSPGVARAERPVTLSWHNPMAVSRTPHAPVSVKRTEQKRPSRYLNNLGPQWLLGSRTGIVSPRSCSRTRK